MKNLIETVKSIRPFVPAKNFALSKEFYLDLGFSIAHADETVVGFTMGSQGFLLQNFYNEQFVENYMMQLLVTDVDSWWERIQKLPLKEKYGVHTPKPPKDEVWGLKVLYVIDPSGVLWHIAQPGS